jgi:hypothetical protein
MSNDETKQQRIMRLIDEEGETLSKREWIELLEEISTECETRAEATRDELGDEDEDGDDDAD